MTTGRAEKMKESLKKYTEAIDEYSAVKQYLWDHPEVAERLTQEDNGKNSSRLVLKSGKEVHQFIGSLTPEEAFRLGAWSNDYIRATFIEDNSGPFVLYKDEDGSPWYIESYNYQEVVNHAYDVVRRLNIMNQDIFDILGFYRGEPWTRLKLTQRNTSKKGVRK